MQVENYYSSLFIFLSLISFNRILAQDPPSGFASVTVSDQWKGAAGLTFSEDGTEMFVWERGGKVWVVKDNQRQILIDITEEVGSWHDHGLLGFALHPHFDQNGYFYMFYLVDRHHLMNYGTAAYSPTTNEFFRATIGRLTRYTATKTTAGYTVDPASRKILIGETRQTGIPCTQLSHVVGSLVFGTDETLLVSTGDGAGASIDYGSGSNTYFAQALIDGIITPAENVGTFRSQLLESHNGKILRINPETGEGISSNPFYDASRPFSAISRVYALGLRQPFKMTLKPGTGSHNPADGNPGTLFYGEVGYMTREEVNVVDKPGMNMGWPIYEGFGLSVLAPYITYNLTAPNPLYQVNGCTQQYFSFQDLLKQATASGQTTFPNPCNTGQSIPSSIKTFMHSRPAIDWAQDFVQVRTGIFNGETAGVINIGAPGSPVDGPQFDGTCSVGGVFYTGNDFPPEYQNTYFFGDFSGAWIRNLTVNETDKPVLVRNFIDQGAIVVGMATHPTEEGLYYVHFDEVNGEIRKVYYSANRPPVAVASVDNAYGPAPLLIQFTGSNSTDPENQQLTYEWNFGDGSPLSTVANPAHSFTAPPGVPTKYTITLTVRDIQNVSNQTTLIVSVNNTPPQVSITSPVDGTLYPMDQEPTYFLQATVTDQEHSLNQLSYQWQTIMHHENHEHPEPIDSNPESTTTISPVGCDGETYYYRIILTVTDAAGASDTDEVRLYPDCGNVKFTPLITWATPAPITSGTALSATQLNATASYNGIPVAGTFTYTPVLGTVLGLGNGQQLAVSFAPDNTTLYNPANKAVLINVVAPVTTAFYRGINLNGAALSIDGNPWQASTSAPNFTYTTSNTVFVNQAITLVPPTDINRATMIRSSIWGGNVTLTVSSVPPGSYQVWLYVWEDNISQTYSISLEGIVVRANYVSGGAGVWSKLGPFQATINDGAINVSAAGGHANLSGLEIWSMQSGGNQPPVVSNAIPDQTATEGTAFSFTFAANTFTDPNAGTVLTYSASLTGGGALPAWLNFNASTRDFSGTPGSGNVGPLNVRVTASDGAGGSVNDDFELTVNPATPVTPVITWANPAAISLGTALSSTQLNATASYNGIPVAGTFTYTPVLGTVLGLGNGQQLEASFAPTNTTLYTAASKTVTIDVIEITKVTPVITWANPAAISLGTALSTTQLNATASYNGSPVAGTFTYTPVLGTVLGLGNGQQLAVSFAPTNTTLYNPANQTVFIDVVDAPATAFYRGINLNGAALSIDGNPWQASTSAPNFTYTTSNTVFVNQAITLVPPTDINRATMIRSSIWGGNVTLTVSSVPPGSYQVWLYVWEDNISQTYSISLEGIVVRANYVSGGAGVWSKLGPFQATINDGAINVSAAGGHANLSGLEIWSMQSGGNQPPVVSNAIPDQTATEGTAFSFTFAANTFTDPNAGTVLTYSASLTGGGALPAWLNFNASTRDFSGTPGSGNVGPLNVRVTASDGAGGSVNDDFELTVNPATPVTPVITWANPAAISLGTALSSTQLNATASYNGIPVAGTFTYTPVLGTVLGLGNGQQLEASFAPTNTTLYTAASKTVTIDVIEITKVTPVITWANPAAISLGTALSTTQLNATASYNGSPVAGTFTYTPVLGTVLGLGNGQQLAVSFAPTNTTLYNPANQTVFIDVVDAPATAFYRGINLNGAALSIDGNPWQASTSAPNFTYTTNKTVFANQAITLIPPTDINRATMIRSSIWGGNVTLTVSSVPPGSYQVWLYVWEDNISQTYSISLEGIVVRANYVSGGAGVWSKLGPFEATINDGAINVSAVGGHANLSGLEIWSVNQSAGARQAFVTATEAVEGQHSDGLQLSAYPNPFSGKVNIMFTAVESAATRLTMYDTRGVQVRVVFDGSLLAGEREEVEMEAPEMPDGVYVLKLANGQLVKHFKLTIAR